MSPRLNNPVKRLSLLLLGAILAGTGLAAGNDLPDIGSPSDSVITQGQENQIGRMVMRQLRGAGLLVEDTLVQEYITNIGMRLAGHAHDGDQRFTFFVVDQPSINAFALPGGYIGVHTGLITAAQTESELAGVLAHEIAHVTQRHIARAIYDSQRTSMVTTAAMLAAILIGAAVDAGSDFTMGAVAASQAAGIQRQINFTRSNEYEADRVGMGILASAGFDPYGMPAFFETLGRRYGLAAHNVPQILLTHPVTSERVAEARGRARQLPATDVTDTVTFGLVKTRLKVLELPTADEALALYAPVPVQPDATLDERYGRAMSLMRASLWDAAAETFADLLADEPGVIPFHIGRGEALIASAKYEDGLAVFRDAASLFPRNVPLTVSYAEALIVAGRPAEAHEVLLDLLNNVPPTPPQIRLIARAANAAGDVGNAHYYMAEYYISSANLPLAVNQLRMALEAPNVNSVDRARYQARLEFLADNMSEKMRKELDEIIAGEPRTPPDAR
jgi:predicted Zn-dependent protease